MVNSTFAFPVLKYGIQSKKTSSPKKRNQFKKILKKNILSTYPDAWSILLPCFALYVYVFVFVLPCSFFFFLLISNCLYNVCSVLLDQEFVLLYYTMYVES